MTTVNTVEVPAEQFNALLECFKHASSLVATNQRDIDEMWMKYDALSLSVEKVRDTVITTGTRRSL